MSSMPSSSNPRRTDLQCVVAAFLAQPGLPFASVLSAERIERIFVKHGNQFGLGGIYSTAVMVWSFVCQVLHDGKSTSCQAAVARVAAHQQQIGGPVPTADAGDYCRARAKLSEAALHDLSVEIADELEDEADAAWLWKGLHAKLVDGFTFTMPDTARNQAVYPSPKTQKKGVGLPIARATIVLSLATAAALELAAGPYSGKQIGDTALLRNHIEYNAFGQITSQTNGTCKPLQTCTDQLQNSGTGMLYYDACWFDPRTIQFLSEDPITFRAGDANLRRYGGNSNSNATDASGLQPIWHHLLAQAERVPEWWLDIDEADFGWIIDSEYYPKYRCRNPLHPNWEGEWGRFFKPFQDAERKPSPAEI